MDDQNKLTVETLTQRLAAEKLEGRIRWPLTWENTPM